MQLHSASLMILTGFSLALSSCFAWAGDAGPQGPTENSLSSYNRKEERALYPAIDNVTDADERATIFSNMKSIPEDRYNACCSQH
jgi:hypothetical protein